MEGDGADGQSEQPKPSPMKSSRKPSRQLAEEGQLRHPGLERLAPSSAGTGRYSKAHQKENTQPTVNPQADC